MKSIAVNFFLCLLLPPLQSIVRCALKRKEGELGKGVRRGALPASNKFRGGERELTLKLEKHRSCCNIQERVLGLPHRSGRGSQGVLPACSQPHLNENCREPVTSASPSIPLSFTGNSCPLFPAVGGPFSQREKCVSIHQSHDKDQHSLQIKRN